MSKPAWQTGKPPNEVVVEAMAYNRKILRVLAFYGRDGYLPHWRSEDGGTSYEPAYFTKWREAGRE